MAISNRYDVNKTRYTHRDYESIKEDLINAIPSLTQEWTSREDSDPGIVLIKLMAMFGDTLSFNVDKIALEMFMQSVTQRKNCRKILSLLGYKMRWYRSAKVIANTRLVSGAGSITLMPYQTIYNAGNLKYTVVGYDPILISSEIFSEPVPLVQGTPATVTFSKSDLRNNRYYFSSTNVDEVSFSMTESDGLKPCELVEDLYLVTDRDKIYYEFNVDDYERPYIELINDWENILNEILGSVDISSTSFTLSYILSDGSRGNVTNDAFNSISGISGSGSNMVSSSSVIINNMENSTPYGDTYGAQNSYNSPGRDPQTVFDAKVDSANYVFTHDTLVTATDYEKAAKRQFGITISKMVDNQIIKLDNLNVNGILTRADDDFTESSSEYGLSPYLVLLYLGYQDLGPEYNHYSTTASEYRLPEVDPYWNSESAFTDLGFYPYKPIDNILTSMDTAIEQYKALTVYVDYGTIKLFPFRVQGTLYLVEPLSPRDTLQVLDNVSASLALAYYPDLHPIGDKPNFIELVDLIQNADQRIKYFDSIGNIVQWAPAVNTSDSSADNYMDKIFDTTSAILYNGLSDNFKIDSKFMRFRLKNTGVSTDAGDSTIEGSEGQRSTTETAYLVYYSEEKSLLDVISIGVGQEYTVVVETIDQLKALVKDMRLKTSEYTGPYVSQINPEPEALSASVNNLGLQWIGG